MERPNVPKFGQWDKQDEVPYTAYFDKARKGRGGKMMINPNDPEENPELYGDMSSDNSTGRKGSMDDTSAHHHNRQGSNSSRPSRVSAGSEHSIDRSPLHPHYRAKAAGSVGASASPARDSKTPHHGTQQGNRTPGRSRMKQASSKDHGTPDRGGAPIPRFGGWDDNDPDSAENYTHIFNVARVEKQTGSSNTPPPANSDPSYYKPKQRPHDQGRCCFGWLGK